MKFVIFDIFFFAFHQIFLCSKSARSRLFYENLSFSIFLKLVWSARIWPEITRNSQLWSFLACSSKSCRQNMKYYFHKLFCEKSTQNRTSAESLMFFFFTFQNSFKALKMTKMTKMKIVTLGIFCSLGIFFIQYH